MEGIMSFITEHFLGTIVNFAVVLVAGILGALIKRGIPKRISDAIMAAMAICVIYIGIEGVLEKPEGGSDGLLSPGLLKVLVLIISMAIGTLIGELLNLEGLVEKLGGLIEKRLGRLGQSGSFARGFVGCSLLFCVGAMTVNGAIAGAEGNHEILLAKSVIDGIACFVMATSLGIGCAFSAFFVLIYQGAIGALGLVLISVLSPAAVSYMSMTGSLIIILVGTNVLGMTRVRTANMVPAMFVSIGVEAILSAIF